MPGLQNLIRAAGGIISQLIVIMMAVAVLVFFWGLLKFIVRVGGDEKAVGEGKNIMKWGVLSLFVMVSVWGIIGFFQRAFNLPDINTTQNAPVPGNLPSRNIIPTPGNYPEPGNLPSHPITPPFNSGPL